MGMSALSFVVLVCLATLIQLLKIRGELQNQNVWHGRKELRQLDDRTLSLLQRKFDHFQQESANNATLIDVLKEAEMTKDSIIERLEKSFEMTLPYWDYRMDVQLTKPDDSSIMLMEFCHHANMNATNDTLTIRNVNETEREIDLQLVKIEERCRSGALLTFLRETFPPNKRKFLKFSEKTLQILQEVTDQRGCSLCATENSKKWLFCDRRSTHRCVSKIIPNGDCTKFANSSESCFQSRCHRGRCTPRELTNVLNVSENITNTRNPNSSPVYLENLEELKIFTSQPETTSLTRNSTLGINSRSSNTLQIAISRAENNSVYMKSSDRVISKGKYRVSEYVPIKSLKFRDLEKHYWTNISDIKNNSHLADDKKEIIFTERHLNRNRKKFRMKYFGNKDDAEIIRIHIQKYSETIHPIQQHDNSTFRTKKLSKYGHYHRKLKQHRRMSKSSKSIVHLYGYDRPSSSKDLPKLLKSSRRDSRKMSEFSMNDVKLSDKELYTTGYDKKSCQFLFSTTATLSILPHYVYFSITVIEGKPKRNNLLNRAVSTCDITLTGANMPYGFTEKIKGELIQRKTSAIVRTLNPEIFGPLVEFSVAVNDQYGKPCQQKCLNRKGSYGNCENRPIRLASHEFTIFSDPIEFYESEKSLLECQWTGRGYYRKRKRDFLLFICDE
uniref:MANSC domain-containing protein n=1 Tax=Elaeophora elaphi TaxID=1147741 RepID=A0A0R3RY54_9BILA